MDEDVQAELYPLYMKHRPGMPPRDAMFAGVRDMLDGVNIISRRNRPVPLPGDCPRPPSEWYEARGDRLRFFDLGDAGRAGLDSITPADALCTLRHTGWYTRSEGWSDIIAGVVVEIECMTFRRPRKKAPYNRTVTDIVYVPGYVIVEGTGARKGIVESAEALVIANRVYRKQKGEAREDVMRECALYADGMAEAAAEEEREYNDHCCYECHEHDPNIEWVHDNSGYDHPGLCKECAAKQAEDEEE